MLGEVGAPSRSPGDLPASPVTVSETTSRDRRRIALAVAPPVQRHLPGCAGKAARPCGGTVAAAGSVARRRLTGRMGRFTSAAASSFYVMVIVMDVHNDGSPRHQPHCLLISLIGVFGSSYALSAGWSVVARRRRRSRQTLAPFMPGIRLQYKSTKFRLSAVTSTEPTAPNVPSKCSVQRHEQE